MVPYVEGLAKFSSRKFIFKIKHSHLSLAYFTICKNTPLGKHLNVFYLHAHRNDILHRIVFHKVHIANWLIQSLIYFFRSKWKCLSPYEVDILLAHQHCIFHKLERNPETKVKFEILYHQNGRIKTVHQNLHELTRGNVRSFGCINLMLSGNFWKRKAHNFMKTLPFVWNQKNPQKFTTRK